MAVAQKKNNDDISQLLVNPTVGNVLAILSGLAFLLVGMLLPLVGKAGAQTEHYVLNFITFMFFLLVACALSGLNLFVRLMRRKQDGSPYPKASLALCVACGVLLVSLIFGLLKI
ncbi:MAG TPA: hypothetical protein PJ991_04485 [Kiritimatiellia bacterium]|nr:hypothetical protein [Kiritimatiellia bacterium]